MEIKHPKWSKVILLPLVIFLIALAMLVVLFCFKDGTKSFENLLLISTSILLVYAACLVYDLHSYRNVEMRIDEGSNAIVITNGQTSVRLVADEVSYRNMDTLQLISFYRKTDGEKLAVFDHVFPNGKEIVRWSKEHLTRYST